jgi:Holliday junction resolvasome RuvABC endonuclease subunit
VSAQCLLAQPVAAPTRPAAAPAGTNGAAVTAGPVPAGVRAIEDAAPPTLLAGIDMSLTGTGLALLSRAGRVQLGHSGQGGHRDDPLVVTHQRIAALTWWVTRHVPPSCVLAVAEAPAYDAVGGSAHDRSGLWWHVVAMLLERGTPVATVAPATRAKYATGDGRASKHQVYQAVAGRFGVQPGSYDEADALACAWMGAHWLGWLPGTPQRAACLQAARWPEMPPATPTGGGSGHGR